MLGLSSQNEEGTFGRFSGAAAAGAASSGDGAPDVSFEKATGEANIICNKYTLHTPNALAATKRNKIFPPGTRDVCQAAGIQSTYALW